MAVEADVSESEQNQSLVAGHVSLVKKEHPPSL